MGNVDIKFDIRICNIYIWKPIAENQRLQIMISNLIEHDSGISLRDTFDHLGSIWYHLEPTKDTHYTNQVPFLGGTRYNKSALRVESNVYFGWSIFLLTLI